MNRLHDVPTLTPAECQKINEWNATHRPYPKSDLLHQLFERQVARNPDKIALVHGGHAVSYGALNSRSDRWARRLQGEGVGPEVLVGVHLPRSAEMVAVLLGVLKAGGAYVPLDPGYPQERLEFMAADARMAVLVTGDDTLTLRHRAAVLRHTDIDSISRGDSVGDGHDPCPANPAYVLYTSGSTGRPKGAMLTHRNATDLLYWSAETFGGDLNGVLATTSICFDCSILELFGPLSRGGTAILAENALEIGDLQTGYDVRLLHTVPSTMAELLRSERLPRTVTTLLLGGETPWPRLVEDVYAYTSVTRVLNLYGPTECTSYATMAILNRPWTEAPPIGRPVANTRVYLLNEDGEPVPAGTPGEIYIAGEGLARGYLNRPDLTAERFVPDPFGVGERVYRSGDLARYDESGEITFTGRVDHQVKVRGVRIEPGEVEHALMRHPAIREVAVLAQHNDYPERRLVAYVVWDGQQIDGRQIDGRQVPEERQTPTASSLRADLSERLPRQLVPDAFVFLDRLPHAPNGKIDRRQLATADSVGCGGSTYVAPRDDVEARLANIWAAAFGIERVGVFDDFFELGGQSLVALRVRMEVGDALGVDLPLRLLFERPTIAGLREALRHLRVDPQGKTTSQASSRAPINTPIDRIEGGPSAAAPLSSTQLATWRRVGRDPDDPALHLSLAVRLTGPLNQPALAMSLTELIRRHEALRTILVDLKGNGADAGESEEIAQSVAAPTAIPLLFVDLSELPADLTLDRARTLAAAAEIRRFHLRAGAPFRTALIRLGDADHVLTLTLHQLVGDVWSMESLGHQLIALYHTAIDGMPASLPEPTVQYPAWARRQRQWLSSPTAEAHRRYWLDLLDGAPTLRLRADRRIRTRRPGSAACELAIPRTLVTGLTALGRQESATPFMVLLTAFKLVLSHYSEQKDIVVGCPMTGRGRPDQELTIGPFINAVVTRCHLTDDPTFREMLDRVRESAWEAYSHQDYPFAELVAELTTDQDVTRHPIYQASMVLHHPAPPAGLPPGLAVAPFERRPPGTTLDVDLALYEGDEELFGALTYRTDVLDQVAAESFAADFQAMLEAAATRPDTPISALHTFADWTVSRWSKSPSQRSDIFTSTS